MIHFKAISYFSDIQNLIIMNKVSHKTINVYFIRTIHDCSYTMLTKYDTLTCQMNTKHAKNIL